MIKIRYREFFRMFTERFSFLENFLSMRKSNVDLFYMRDDENFVEVLLLCRHECS